MSDNMVEKVARAIYEQRNGYGCAPWRSRVREHKAPYLADARAAIEAMRTPTPKMLAETLPAPGIHCDPKTTRLAEMALHLLEPHGTPDKAHLSGLDAARALIGDWYSMIDASLHEGEAQR